MEGACQPNALQIRGAEYTRKRQQIALLKGAGIGLASLPLVAGGTAESIRRFALSTAHDLFALALVIEFVLMTAPIFVSLLIADWLQYKINVRYGISLEKPASAVGDMLRRSALRMAILMLAILLVYGSYALLESWWWVGGGIALAALWITYIYVFPTLILPLFFKLERVIDEHQLAVIHNLAGRARVSIEQVFSLKISEKFNHSNMAIAGIGKRRMLILTDTIMRDCSPEEFEALLAHELGHVRHHDVEKRAAALAALSFVSCWMATFLLAFLDVSLADIGSMPALCGSLLVPYCFGVVLISRLWRGSEFKADEFAFRLIGDTTAFVSALKRISEKNLIQVTRKNQHRFAHPATEERIRRAQAFGSACATLTNAASAPR